MRSYLPFLLLLIIYGCSSTSKLAGPGFKGNVDPIAINTINIPGDNKHVVASNSDDEYIITSSSISEKRLFFEDTTTSNSIIESIKEGNLVENNTERPKKKTSLLTFLSILALILSFVLLGIASSMGA